MIQNIDIQFEFIIVDGGSQLSICLLSYPFQTLRVSLNRNYNKNSLLKPNYKIKGHEIKLNYFIEFSNYRDLLDLSELTNQNSWLHNLVIKIRDCQP